MIVMYHKFGFEKAMVKIISWMPHMVVLGEFRFDMTAMAKTVGPAGSHGRTLLNPEWGKVTERGVQIPISAGIYDPVLKGLSQNGIVFREYQRPYLGYNPDSVAS